MIDNAIIGGGIGGLTTAVALHQRNIRFTLFEQTSVIKPIGAGILAATNAMQVYKTLGIADDISALGQAVHYLNVTNANLKTLSELDLRPLVQKFKAGTIAIHRADLQQYLLAQFPESMVLTNKKLVDVKRADQWIDLTFADGSSYRCKTLIGADGLRSTTRQLVFGKKTLRSSGQYCWRGVAEFDLPEKYCNALFEAWSDGLRFGFVGLGKRRVYWYALISMNRPFDPAPVELESYFSAFHPMIVALLAATNTNSIHSTEIMDLQPIKTWAKGNVALLGDAAHGATPNMGQGGCQAIEDAAVVAQMLEKLPAKDAFQRYNAIRIAKAHYVVRNSWRLGRMAHWQHPLPRNMRDTLMRITPASYRRRHLKKLFTLDWE
jgi:2-polyprenyl-6-methoxyphenol hydroxylase-like FAD-dependent oxidoreductase